MPARCSSTRLLGQTASGDAREPVADRFRARWVQALLPFRMPRALAAMTTGSHPGWSCAARAFLSARPAPCDVCRAAADQFEHAPPERKEQDDEELDQAEPGRIHDAAAWSLDATRSGRAPELLPPLQPLEQIDHPHKRDPRTGPSSVPGLQMAPRHRRIRDGIDQEARLIAAAARASERADAMIGGDCLHQQTRLARRRHDRAARHRIAAEPLHLAADLGIEQPRGMDARPARERKAGRCRRSARVQDIGRAAAGAARMRRSPGRTPAAPATHPDRCRPRAAIASGR